MSDERMTVEQAHDGPSRDCTASVKDPGYMHSRECLEWQRGYERGRAEGRAECAATHAALEQAAERRGLEWALSLVYREEASLSQMKGWLRNRLAEGERPEEPQP